MPTTVNQITLNKRRKDCINVINKSGSYVELSKIWGITRSGALMYVQNNLSQYENILSENGTNKRYVSYEEYKLRVKLLLLYKSGEILLKDAADYIGIYNTRLCTWKTKNISEPLETIYNDFFFIDHNNNRVEI